MMNSVQFTTPEQQGSGLLSAEENELIFQLLGPRCQTLATTVVQLYATVGPDHNDWMKKDVGVLCLVKDNPRRSYFFRIYCLSRRGLVWEHEIYNDIDYLAPRRFLHTFEAEDCIAAFNFASEEEADWLRGVLLKKTEEKKQRRERRARGMHHPQNHHAAQPFVSLNGTASQHSVTNLPVATENRRAGRRKERDGKRKFTKADIGTPQDFRHVSHVGFDPIKGFDYENVDDPQLKKFFDMAGVSAHQLQDKATRQFIYDFIERHGGIDAVKNNAVVRPPPVPARAAPPAAGSHISSRAAPPPPPPPPRTEPLPPVAPPPLPPLRTLPQRQPETSSQGNWSAAPPPPPMSSLPTSSSSISSSAPAPPPPPPAPPMSPPPDDFLPPPSSSGGTTPRLAPPVVDSHSALMEDIRSGKILKHVKPDDRPAKTIDSRNELLDQIRQGIELKPVQPDSKPVPNALPEDGLAGALKRALEERSRAIHSDSSGSSNEGADDEDEEWE